MKVNYNFNRAVLGSPWGERDWTDTVDHLIFNDHHLFDLNLVKKIVDRGGQQASQAPRLVREVPE